MRLKIKNASWRKRLLLTAAVAFFEMHLKGFLTRNPTVEVTLVQYLRLTHRCRAQAFQDSPTHYSIQMDSSLGTLASVRCLAHEMIHVSQWLTGKMVDVDGARNKVQWMKRVYSSRIAYRKHPWEIEAYRYDKAVAKKFIDYWNKEGK